jgi:ectoine hydroxylase-related dioxygenase (phytanoyl-CoA dioxygenase family)
MVTNLEKQESDMQLNKEQLEKDGYIILKNFFDKDYIETLRQKAENIFEIQFKYFGYTGTFKENMIRLFNEQESIFINCGKIIQTGLLELYKLPLEDKLINYIKDLGLEFPNLCTRPVLYFNHPKLAKEIVYYKTPPHQDWSSMLSSMDSLVVWVPLVDVNKENGSIIVYPGTHKLGPLPFETNGGFAEVKTTGNGIQPELEAGDIAIFSTLLVHESGDITNDSIRWSCHFRYTNMLDQDFIERGFPNPYVYKPITKQ